jgi:hypothetical protein
VCMHARVCVCACVDVQAMQSLFGKKVGLPGDG